MNAHDAHGVEIFFGEHAFAFFFDVEDALLQLMDRLFQSRHAFAAEQFGLLAQFLQIRHRLLAVKSTGGQQFHRQIGKHMGDRRADRQGAYVIVQAASLV